MWPLVCGLLQLSNCLACFVVLLLIACSLLFVCLCELQPASDQGKQFLVEYPGGAPLPILSWTAGGPVQTFCQVGDVYPTISEWQRIAGRRIVHDLTNTRFGLLTALAPGRKNGERAWVCRCECGGQSIVHTNQLMAGRIRSCGCSRGKRIE